MRWLGHPIESPKLPYTGHHWTRRGKGKSGRLRTTLRRKITSELEEMGFSMGQAQYITKDRRRWRQIVDALCPIGDEEDR
jgi:hypothetical protein